MDRGAPPLWQVMEQAGEVHKVALPIEGHRRPVAHEGVSWRPSYSGQQLQSCELHLGMHVEPWRLQSLHASRRHGSRPAGSSKSCYLTYQGIH